MAPQRSTPSSRGVPTWEKCALTALFGGLIVAAFAYQAMELAESLGAVAYPLVVGIAIASFILSRLGWRVLTAEVDARVRNQRRIDDVTAD